VKAACVAAAVKLLVHSFKRLLVGAAVIVISEVSASSGGRGFEFLPAQT
jgi:hypothetical protein